MITRLRLVNFKAWRELRVRFATVTGVFGANSAGKSSLVQFLLLLKQTRDATDRRIVLNFGRPESLANLGSYRDVVHRHDTSLDIGWQLAWTLPKRLEIATQSADQRSVTFAGKQMEARCTVGLSDPDQPSTLLTRTLAYEFDDSEFALKPSEGKTRADKLTINSRHPHFALKRTRGRPFHIPPPAKTHLFPQQLKWSYHNADLLGDLELEYEKLMDRIHYLGPLRDYPQRQYYWSGASPDDVGPRGERAIDAILAATAQGERRQLKKYAHYQPFQQIIARWLRQLGLIDRFSIEEIGTGSNLYQAQVTAKGSNASTTLTDVGFGVSQVLPVLVLLYYVPERSVVMLEQPEIHLHPAVQSRLADLFLCVAKHRNLQLIVESHSQHLLQRLQRRVAEGECHVPGLGTTFPFHISSTDVRLYFSSIAGGVGKLADLKLNRWGEIENWPDDFFGNEMGEIAAITRAGLRRRMAEGEG